MLAAEDTGPGTGPVTGLGGPGAGVDPRNGDSAQPAPEPSSHKRRFRRMRNLVGELAAWTGLANLIFVLGSNIYRQWDVFPDWTGGADPLGGARETAITGAVVGALALLSGRLRWPSILFAGLLGAWAASEALTAFVLNGVLDPRPLWLAVTGAGLAMGAAVAKASWSGWSIFGLGCSFVLLNLYVLVRNYASLGAIYTGAAIWWGPDGWTGELAQRPDWAPAPEQGLKWLVSVLSGDLPGFQFGGLPTNGNLLANYAAFFIVFTVPFCLSRWRSAFAVHRVAVLVARSGLIAVSAVPGAALLLAADANTALIGVLLGWAVLLIPLRWTRNKFAAAAAAAIAPTVVIVPPLLAQAGLISARGRDCVWDSWRVGMSDSLLWGVGQTGGFPGITCDFPWWLHAHNELLQAWWVGGVAGLLSLAGVLALLSWFTVRGNDLDQRTGLSAVVLASLLLGFEVVTTGPLAWIGLGLASFIAIAGRSLHMVTVGRPALP